jgi:tetratricopeptide (TPR) repeat protein
VSKLRSKFAHQLRWVVLGGLVSLFFSPALLAQEPARPVQQSESAKTRQQAYLKFIEAQRLRSEAQRTQNPRRLQESIEAYKEALRLDPSASEPHVDLGELYFFFQSRLDLAEGEALEAARLDPANVGARLLLARISMTALRFEKEQKPEQVERAVRAYEEVVRLDASVTEGWAMLAELYEQRGETAKQLKALEHWTNSTIPGDPAFYRWLMNQDLSTDQAYYELSMLQRKLDHFNEALVAGKKAFELDPSSAVYSRNLIGLLSQLGNIKEELRTFEQLSQTSDSPALQIGYGAALVRAGRYKEAIEKLAGYVKGDPANSNATLLLSMAQRRAGERLAAVESLKNGINAAEPGARTRLMLDLGEVYEELGRNDEAAAQYEKVFDGLLSRGGMNGQGIDLFAHVLSKLTRVYRRAGQQEKLQAAFDRARPVVGDKSAALDLIVIENLREDGKRREALEMVVNAAKRFPEDRSIRLTQALVLSDQRRFKEGIELLRNLLKAPSSSAPEAGIEDAGIYLLLSSIQMQDGQLKDAEASVRKALALNPDDPSLLIQLAAVLERDGKHAEAEKTMRTILEREPGNATALNNLGYFLVERGSRYQEALSLIEQAVSIEPINGSFLDSLGWVQYKLGRIEKAREQLERAVTYSRNSATLHEHLGDVLRDLGRVPEARRQWEKALEFSIEANEIARLKDKLKDGR